MNRRERRNARVAHKKTLQDNNKMLLRSNIKSNEEHRTLFDKVFSKKSGGTPVKCPGIYESVFCRG